MARVNKMKRRGPQYDLRLCKISDVGHLFKKYHPYGSVGRIAVYCFAVYEGGEAVAAYVWQPPPPGSAKSVCPESPGSVLSLSRMVAKPKCDRLLNHVSKPLRRQMLKLIDRTRWPVLVTYSDEGCGHTGHVYKCSGWQKTTKSKRRFYLDASGGRASTYNNGGARTVGLTLGGVTTIQRWEHWACAPGNVLFFMGIFGWQRVPIPGKFWRSGKQAHVWVQTPR